MKGRKWNNPHRRFGSANSSISCVQPLRAVAGKKICGDGVCDAAGDRLTRHTWMYSLLRENSNIFFIGVGINADFHTCKSWMTPIARRTVAADGFNTLLKLRK
jgi:hypothetical protein